MVMPLQRLVLTAVVGMCLSIKWIWQPVFAHLCWSPCDLKSMTSCPVGCHDYGESWLTLPDNCVGSLPGSPFLLLPWPWLLHCAGILFPIHQNLWSVLKGIHTAVPAVSMPVRSSPSRQWTSTSHVGMHKPVRGIPNTPINRL